MGPAWTKDQENPLVRQGKYMSTSQHVNNLLDLHNPPVLAVQTPPYPKSGQVKTPHHWRRCSHQITEQVWGQDRCFVAPKGKGRIGSRSWPKDWAMSWSQRHP